MTVKVHGFWGGGGATPGGGGARAWVNFNGLTGDIRSSLNVSSVTRHGVGDYTINFATPMTDVNYAVVASGSALSVSIPNIPGYVMTHLEADKTTTSCRVAGHHPGVGPKDTLIASVCVFGA